MVRISMDNSNYPNIQWQASPQQPAMHCWLQKIQAAVDVAPRSSEGNYVIDFHEGTVSSLQKAVRMLLVKILLQNTTTKSSISME